MGLFEIYLATEVYFYFPITKDGFRLDTVVIGKNGILERFVDNEQLQALEKIVKTTNMIPLLREFEKYERSIEFIFEKNPIDTREEFMAIFRRLWVNEITSFFIGQYTTDQETIDIISGLRGTKNAQHIAISDFVPKLFKQISESTGIDIDLLNSALPDEIISLKLNLETLKIRRELYVLQTIGQTLSLLVGEEAKKFAVEFTSKMDTSVDQSITEFKGNPAFIGEATGKVVLVRHDNDTENVMEGDILVSPMTRTSFLPAMQLAAAFVTDEGGITCHAAIMAREMKKPCVVGTKIASKVLKNGDLVHVDAKKGIIIKLQ
ncbi:MAG: PEP-utilizing enzyme [bacterium]|nr:PEP-utilizing enzyme [bacterium]